MASSFGLNSFYGGSKGRDSSSTDSELNCVTTRRKAGRPSVSQNKGKKGRTSCEAAGRNIKQKQGKSVDNENASLNSTMNMSQESVNTTSELLSLSALDQVHEENPLNESALGDVLNKGVTNDSALSVGNVLSDSLLKEHIGVENSLSNSGLMEALNANNPMSVDDLNTSQETVE